VAEEQGVHDDDDLNTICDIEGRITTPPTMSGVQKRKAGQSRRHIEAKQSETIYL
jgi:hypothetical protein